MEASIRPQNIIREMLKWDENGLAVNSIITRILAERPRKKQKAEIMVA